MWVWYRIVPKLSWIILKACVLFVAGHQKQVSPDLFRVFYTIWKETEAEAQEVRTCLQIMIYIQSLLCFCLL